MLTFAVKGSSLSLTSIMWMAYPNLLALKLLHQIVFEAPFFSQDGGSCICLDFVDSLASGKVLFFDRKLVIPEEV